jgi:hypothetical protein
VQFSELGPEVNRTARSEQLNVAMKPGFSAIDDAQFSRRVRFVDGAMTATAAAAHYLPDGGTLALTGSERENPVPHVVNDQIQVDAGSMDVKLDGPIVTAIGSAKSVIQPQKPDAKKDPASEVRIPAMLKQDQPVNVTAQRLDYNGNKSEAKYRQRAALAGRDGIKASTLVIDSKNGNLDASGSVATVTVLQQQGKTGAMETVRSVATSNSFSTKMTSAEPRTG